MAHSKKFNFALGVLVISVAAVAPDSDHILPPYTRSWGHLAVIPYAILFSLAITHTCGLFRTWVLRR